MKNAYPQAKRIPSVSTYHSYTKVDHYEWLRERDKDEDVQKLMDAENEWTRHQTRHLKNLQEECVKSLLSFMDEDDISVPVRYGAYWYVKRMFKGKEYPVHYRVRYSEQNLMPEDFSFEDAQLVCDINELAKGNDFFDTANYLISPNSQYACLGIDTSGDEHFDMRIWNIETGEVIDGQLRGVGYGVAWSADSSSIFYVRVNEAWRAFQVWVHIIGDDISQDKLIFEEKDVRFDVSLEPSRCGEHAVIHSASSTSSEVYLVDVCQPFTPPLCVAPRQEGLDYFVECAGDHLLIVHNAHVEDFELSCAPLSSSTPDEWESIMRPRDGERIMWVEAYRDFFCVIVRSGTVPSLRVCERLQNFDGNDFHNMWGDIKEIPHPQGVIHEIVSYNRDWNSPYVLYREEGFIVPPRYCSYHVAAEKFLCVKERHYDGFSVDDYRVERVWVQSSDGISVPMDIICSKDVVKGADNKGILYGYGAYETSNDPYFSPFFLTLARAGYVIGWAHVRGGGEYGRQWYENAKKLKKKNSFEDFYSCARYLYASGWVYEGKLALHGRSAGGLLVGAALNMRPSYFGAVLAGVPFVDVLTTMTKPELPLTCGEWEEWGNPVDSKAVYEYIREYSPVDNVQEGEAYPPMLVTTSTDDVRVSYVEPMKWVQRLRAATSAGAENILLKIDDGGHGGTSGRYERINEHAFECAWLIDVLDN
ncbi:MAG: S9 family peptidase [Actinomycetaceae bacterium]|nr:S9 family peptidase [Actinomycetaceae bacterium]